MKIRRPKMTALLPWRKSYSSLRSTPARKFESAHPKEGPCGEPGGYSARVVGAEIDAAKRPNPGVGEKVGARRTREHTDIRDQTHVAKRRLAATAAVRDWQPRSG